jgi:AraC-like DNA-binding protein
MHISCLDKCSSPPAENPPTRNQFSFTRRPRERYESETAPLARSRKVGHVVIRQAIRMRARPDTKARLGDARSRIRGPRIRQDIEYREIGDIPPLRSVASKLSLSLSLFRHLFKSEVGMSPRIMCRSRARTGKEKTGPATARGNTKLSVPVVDITNTPLSPRPITALSPTKAIQFLPNSSGIRGTIQALLFPAAIWSTLNQ